MCTRIDLFIIFICHIFICSLYSPWATIRLLHHFGFVCVLIWGYPVRIFRAIDAKYVMFCISWHKSLKGSATPDLSFCCSLYCCFEESLIVVGWYIICVWLSGILHCSKCKTSGCSVIQWQLRHSTQPCSNLGCPQAWHCYCVWRWWDSQKILWYSK